MGSGTGLGQVTGGICKQSLGAQQALVTCVPSGITGSGLISHNLPFKFYAFSLPQLLTLLACPLN